jgi:polysaccharide biosynthesis/export protein
MLYKTITKILINHWVLLFAFILMNSCVNMQKVTYLNSSEEKSEFEMNKPTEYLIKPLDELVIVIRSLDDKQTSIEANSISSENNQSQSSGAGVQGQKVDIDGFIELPVIGKINVKDKTTNQVASSLKEAYENILNMPMVSVKLINQTFTIFGEVKNPGNFPLAKDHINIFEAISLSGGVDEYAALKNVIFLRSENNKMVKYYVDISQADIISSPFYYIRPNDIIYIKPRVSKYTSFKNSSIPITVTTIVSLLMLYSTFKLL